MQNRRDVLSHAMTVAGLLTAAGLWPASAMADDVPGYDRTAFDAKTMAEAMKALGAAVPQESKDVALQAPEIAENGAVVPIGVACSAPGVKRLLIMVEKNPAVLSAAFDIGDAIEPNVETRVKLAQTSNVYGVALMGDGRVLFAQKEVKVTLGGCGG